MANWQKLIASEDARNYDRRAALDKPFGMVVKSVADNETAVFSYFGNSARTVLIPHPYVSGGSWIRAIPETGTGYVGMYRMDCADPQPLVCFQQDPSARVNLYKGKKNLYRPLAPGEIEICSSGTAKAFFSRRPMFELYAGSLKRSADQDSLTIYDQAPIHQQNFIGYTSDGIKDCYRVGLVSRPKSTWEVIYPKVRGFQAAEQYIHLKNPAQVFPQNLFTRITGHVLDEKGTQITHSTTSVPLRHLEILYANDETSTKTEIDEKGNYTKTLALGALEGYELKVPSGHYKKTVLRDEIKDITGNRQDSVKLSETRKVGTNLKLTVGNTITVSTDIGQHSIFVGSGGDNKIFIKSGLGSLVQIDDNNQSITVKTTSGTKMQLNPTDVEIETTAKISVKAISAEISAKTIKLGDNATMSAVLSEKLADLFDKHTHPTAVGPSGPPLPPNTAAIANLNPVTAFSSAFVKVQSNM
jgi:hypothetical protein